MKTLIIAVMGLAVALTLTLTPQPAEDVAEALLLGELNNDRAEGAPQQSVVAAWTMRDLLAIEASTVDHRPTVLLAAAVLILGLGTLTNLRGTNPTHATPVAAVPTPDRDTGTHDATLATSEEHGDQPEDAQLVDR
ncbi:hypothetical protein DVS28_a0276 [Euzebya pacifica]|uniref:Uncharacterized protein n=1 Tax=Euzebya pacifica TaxID=1608957 RepID=A0A346XRY6_9ACTN|nr:hypothetical protein [Euzebya pacifica]AXV04983.1 hypothetical protein DVS28_a0276 [Euzebya pacifica]